MEYPGNSLTTIAGTTTWAGHHAVRKTFRHAMLVTYFARVTDIRQFSADML